MSVPCALYRVRDDRSRLLYVGISEAPLSRMAGTDRSSGWAHKAADISIEWHPSRDDARTAESAAILAEDPIHNMNRPGGDQMRWVRWIIAQDRGVHADDVTTAEVERVVDDFCRTLAPTRRIGRHLSGGAG